MLRTYYRLLFLLTGDLGAGALGPMIGNSQDDVAIIQDFLSSAPGSTLPRGIVVQGGEFAEGGTKAAGIVPSHGTLLQQYLAASLRASSYNALADGGEGMIDLLPTGIVDGTGTILGVRNGCDLPNDVLDVNASIPGAAVAAYYENRGSQGPFAASVYAPASVSRPFVSLLNGFDIDRLRNRHGESTFGRVFFFYQLFQNVFSSLCSIAGTPVGVDDPRAVGGVLPDAVRVLGNPVRDGSARIALTLASREHARVVVYDIAGRAVRTLANRTFEPGEHTLVWDGADDGGRALARGVYFVRVHGLARGVEATRTVVFLR
jgi:hypothetical protein